MIPKPPLESPIKKGKKELNIDKLPLDEFIALLIFKGGNEELVKTKSRIFFC